MDDSLEEERVKLDKVSEEFANLKTDHNQKRLRVARSVYRRKFEEFQKKIRKKLGLPSGRIVWQRPAKEIEHAG